MTDCLKPEYVLEGLGTAFVGRNIVYRESLPSTMDLARDEGRRGVPEGTLIIAEKQTAGRGRLRRSWLSSEGGIAVSLVLRPAAQQLPQMIMVASLAVVCAIEKVTGLKADIKWPNDVLISGKKVCGILIENQFRGSSVEFTVIGMGINVNMDPSGYPEIAQIATSLSAQLGREVPRIQVLKALLAEVERFYLVVRDGGSVHLLWRKRLVTLGQEVQLGDAGATEAGIAEDVQADGTLLLRRRDGSLLRVVAGDVTLRPASGGR